MTTPELIDLFQAKADEVIDQLQDKTEPPYDRETFKQMLIAFRYGDIAQLLTEISELEDTDCA